MMHTPDGGAWLGSGLGRDAEGKLRVYCDEPSHELTEVRSFRRSEGAGWWVNPNTDVFMLDDPAGMPPGSELRTRVRVSLRCPSCDINAQLTGTPGQGDGALEILDNLVDGGVSDISLARLCQLVSRWR